jgi:hypothetical protein
VAARPSIKRPTRAGRASRCSCRRARPNRPTPASCFRRGACRTHPKAQFLAASHTTELAERWGRRVRNLIAEKRQQCSGSPDEDNQAAGRWAIKEGGEYLAAGARIGIAGFRALFGVIDDPLALA